MNSATTSLQSFTPPASRGLAYRAWLAYIMVGYMLLSLGLYWTAHPYSVGPMFGLALFPTIIRFFLSAGLPFAMMPRACVPLSELHHRHRRYRHLRKHVRNRGLFRRLMRELRQERSHEAGPVLLSWPLNGHRLGLAILLVGFCTGLSALDLRTSPTAALMLSVGWALFQLLPRATLPPDQRWRAWAWDLGVVLEGHKPSARR